MKKIISIIMVSIIILSMSMLNVYAIKAVSMRISPSKGEVKQGELITFTFSTTDLQLDSNDQGIQGIEGYIDINKNIFEDITQENFEGLNGWDINQYNPTNGKIIITRGVFITTAGDAFKLTVKLKSNATLGITQIKFKDVTVSSASLAEFKLASEVLTQVNVTASTEAVLPSPTPTTTTNQPIFSSPTPTTSTNPIVYPSSTPSAVPTPTTSPITSTTTKPSPTPTDLNSTKDVKVHAGKENFIIPAMIVVAIFAIISYTKYRKI